MTPEENERLTRVGPGTPGGEMLRRYWWPVGFADEIRDKPVAIRHLGEDFVLFRDGTGAIGMLDIACSHRRASLDLGRVEARGLRCCYHGWLYATDGRCLEMPAEPPDSTFPAKVCQRAARVIVAADIVFAYLGPDPIPTFPRYDLLYREDCDRIIGATEEHCNWVQRAENGVDPYHSMALHAAVYPSIALQRADVDWDPTWYGFRIESRYPNGQVNVIHDIFPSSTRYHTARVGRVPHDILHIRVPVDDERTLMFFVRSHFKSEGPYTRECAGFKRTVRGEYERVDDGWWGIASNDQDRAAQESQGLIHDRTREMLGSSDRGIILWRRNAFASIAAVAEGRDPYGVLRDRSDEIIDLDASKNFSDQHTATVSA